MTRALGRAGGMTEREREVAQSIGDRRVMQVGRALRGAQGKPFGYAQGKRARPLHWDLK